MVMHDTYAELLSEKCVLADSLHLLPRLKKNAEQRPHIIYVYNSDNDDAPGQTVWSQWQKVNCPLLNRVRTFLSAYHRKQKTTCVHKSAYIFCSRELLSFLFGNTAVAPMTIFCCFLLSEWLKMCQLNNSLLETVKDDLVWASLLSYVVNVSATQSLGVEYDATDSLDYI